MGITVSDVTNFLGITNTKAKEPILPIKSSFDPEKEGDRKVLMDWDTVTRTNEQVNNRPSMSRSFWIIGAVVALLLVAMQEFLLIAVIASVIFVKHILSATPARMVHHTLTTHGITYSGQFYGWNELTTFYFTSDNGVDTLCVNTKDRLPGRLFLLVNNGDKDKVHGVVSQYLSFLKEAPRTMADKMFENMMSKIPSDK